MTVWNNLEDTSIPEQGQSNTPLNSFVALLHRDQCPLQSQHVLNKKKHKPLSLVGRSPFLSLSTSV